MKSRLGYAGVGFIAGWVIGQLIPWWLFLLFLVICLGIIYFAIPRDKSDAPA